MSVLKKGKVNVFIMAVLSIVLCFLIVSTFHVPLLALDSASCTSGKCSCKCAGTGCTCTAKDGACDCKCDIGDVKSCSQNTGKGDPDTDPPPV